MDEEFLISKISNAKFNFDPFKYLYIENFIPKEDFENLITNGEVLLKEAKNDKELLKTLKDSNWEPIVFPGSTTNLNDYLEWKKGKGNYDNVNTCEGFGITFRLNNPKSKLIKNYIEFFKSNKFLNVIKEKFNIDISKTHSDVGFQKYLDGYEISPHPDVRKKALTFMLNVNSNPKSLNEYHHCHFNQFLPSKKYIEEYWKGNKNVDRSWVPWEWCTTKFLHNENNSITIFSPDDNTLHSVKAKYNHLKHQRTQLYGNLWYKNKPIQNKPCWEDFIINASKEKRTSSLKKEKINRQNLF